MKAPSSKKEILPPEVYSIKTLNKNPEESNEQKCSMVYLNLNTKSFSFCIDFYLMNVFSYEDENFGKGVNYRRKYKTTKLLK